MASDPRSSHDSATTTDARAAAAADGAVPAIDLGAGLTPIAFAPGRYASVVQRNLQGNHAAQRVRESGTASFVLELAADGTATACRGWRYEMTNRGPGGSSEDGFREQQGYRGRYTVQGGVVELTLTSDDGVCPPVREHAHPPQRAATLALRCARAMAADRPELTGAVLVCEWPEAGATAERAAHLVAGLGPAGWIVLGADPGLHVKETGAPRGMRSTAAPTLTVEPAPAPIAADAWQRPL